MSLLNVHNVIVDSGELFNSLVKLIEDFKDSCGKLFTLGVTNFNFLEFVELNDCAGKMHNILTSLGEGIKPDKESIGCNFPGVLSFCLILEVGILELRADIKSKGKLVVCFLGFIVLDEAEDLFTINEVLAFHNDSIADFPD